MEKPAYQELLHKLFEQYIECGNMGELATALGCVTLRYESNFDDRWEKWTMYSPDQPQIQYEDLVCRTLVDALLSGQLSSSRFDLSYDYNRKMYNFFKIESLTSFIDGLQQNRRWEKCLSTLEGAHRLAALLVCFPSIHYAARHFGAGAAMTHAISPGACGIANAWLKPDVPYAGGELIGSFVCERLARNIFGSAWCDLMIDGVRFEKISSAAMYDFIVASKPPFRPGLLPDHLVQPALPLPEMTA